MSNNTKNCPLCGRFMEKRPSVKYGEKLVCDDCGMVKIPDRSTTPKWKQMSKR